MLKIYASLVDQSSRSHSLEISWYFARHQFQRHKLSLGVLILTWLKTALLLKARQFVHILFSFHGLLEGIKSKHNNYDLFQGVLIMLKNYGSPVGQSIRSHSFQFS